MAQLQEYDDLLANVRWDNRFHSVRNLVQPFDPDVIELSHILHVAPNFPEAAHAFVHSYTTYGEEPGDFWRTPAESLDMSARKEGIDCDDSAILLASLLRNYLPPDRVFCAAGIWTKNGRGGGHMWVEVARPGGGHDILESTASSLKAPYGLYETSVLFNDEFAFATKRGLSMFGMIPVEDVVETLVAAGAIPRV
jgi:hypothetical protein